MRVLAVTSEWPDEEHPDAVPFVVRQVESLRSLGVTVEVFAFRGATRPQNYMRARREVRRRLAHAGYDVVHAHFGQAGLVAVPVRSPLVVTFYGSDLEGVVGRSGRYTLRGRVLRRLSRGVARTANRVIVLSERLGRRLPRSVSYTVIPTPLDLQVFQPRSRSKARAELGLPANRKLVLFSGRPDVPVKRYDLAREVVSLVDPDAMLVTLSGRSHHEVSQYMNACDVLLVTSKHEGGPATVKEALACNLPVVSTDVGDVSRWLKRLEGCAVCDDDPRAIAAGLGDVLRDERRFVGRFRVEELEESLIARRILDVYTSAIADRSGSDAPSATRDGS